MSSFPGKYFDLLLAWLWPKDLVDNVMPSKKKIQLLVQASQKREEEALFVFKTAVASTYKVHLYARVNAHGNFFEYTVKQKYEYATEPICSW